MQEGGFYQSNRISPARLGIVIGLHAAAIGALALAKMEVVPGTDFDPIDIIDVRTPPPPPPPPEPRPQPDTKSRSQLDTAKQVLPTPSDNIIIDPPRRDPVVFDTGPVGDADPKPQPEVILPPPPPPPPPARVEAKLRSGELQPPYPASEVRLGNEGKVVVRIAIGADGRVKAVERVWATSDAFFRATERHAMRAWRFAPATEDGRPVESRKTMTVTFKLD